MKKLMILASVLLLAACAETSHGSGCCCKGMKEGKQCCEMMHKEKDGKAMCSCCGEGKMCKKHMQHKADDMSKMNM